MKSPSSVRVDSSPSHPAMFSVVPQFLQGQADQHSTELCADHQERCSSPLNDCVSVSATCARTNLLRGDEGHTFSVPRMYPSVQLRPTGTVKHSCDEDEDMMCCAPSLSAPPPPVAFRVLTSNRIALAQPPSSSKCFLNASSLFISQVPLDFRRMSGTRLGVERGRVADETMLRQVDVGLSSMCVPCLSTPMRKATTPERSSTRHSQLCRGVLCNDNLGAPSRAPLLNVSKPFSLQKSWNIPHDTSCVRGVVTKVAHSTLSGYRETQEDAVCMHERVTFLSECAAREGLVSWTCSVYGVFDGHNGGRLSNLASWYYVEHLREALSRQLPAFVSGGTVTQALATGDNGDKKDDERCEKTPYKVMPPQRFLSSALVQALVHLDRTLYDMTYHVDKRDSGTTACIAAFYHDSSAPVEGRVPCYLSMANLGDSRAVLARISDGCLLVSTLDHRVSSYPSERARIERCGGSVEFDRIDGDLEMTRSLGNFAYKLPPEQWPAHSEVSHEGVYPCFSATPHVNVTLSSSEPGRVACGCACNSVETDKAMVNAEFLNDPFGVLQATYFEREGKVDDGADRHCLKGNVVENVADVYEVELTGDEFLVLATDGLWDCMRPEEVVEFVRMRLLKLGPLNVADSLKPLTPLSAAVSSRSFSRLDGTLTPVSHGVEEASPSFFRNHTPHVTEMTDLFCELPFYTKYDDDDDDNDDDMTVVFCESKGTLPRVSAPLQLPPCAVRGRERRDGHDDTLGCFETPRQALHDVTNSLVDHVVRNLHSTDNVTVVLLVFSREE